MIEELPFDPLTLDFLQSSDYTLCLSKQRFAAHVPESDRQGNYLRVPKGSAAYDDAEFGEVIYSFNRGKGRVQEVRIIYSRIAALKKPTCPNCGFKMLCPICPICS